jgi:single-strand DNA-binding protein
MSVNKVILIGNVGKDPDVRYLDTGIAVATFSLATTDRAYTLQNGTQVPERTEWHNIVLWRGLAQTAEKYVRKGDKLYIEGKIRSRSYDDQNGIKRTIVEIFADNMEMLTPRNTSQQPGTGYVPQVQAVSHQQTSAQAAPQQQQASDNSLTDDLPF